MQLSEKMREYFLAYDPWSGDRIGVERQEEWIGDAKQLEAENKRLLKICNAIKDLRPY